MAIDPRMAAMMQQGEAEGSAEPGDTTDEDMLEKVRMGMGNEGGPPPGSDLKWQNLQDDQDALVANPTPENVQAFVQYWGQENLPPELAQGGRPQGPPQTGGGGEA